MLDKDTNSIETSEAYVDLYHRANDIRAKGDLISARDHFNEAHSLVDNDSQDIEQFWRGCASLDMVVRCETDLQEPASEVIETMDRYASQIERIYSSLYDDATFKVPLNPRSISELTEFITYIKDLPEIPPSSLNEDQIKKNWLLFYYLSRWAFVMKIYFMRCTSQIDLGHTCGKLSEYTAEKSRKWRNYTGEMVDNADFVIKEEVLEEKASIKDKVIDILGEVVAFLIKEGNLQEDLFLQKLAGVQDWADAHSHIQNILRLMTVGDYKKAAEALLDLEDEIDQMKYTDKLGKEYGLQLKAKRFYAQACTSEDNYDESVTGLRLLFLSSFTKFPKIAIEIKIFEARAALRYSKLDDAITAAKVAKVMIGKADVDESGISDGWLDLIDSQIALLKHKNVDNPEATTTSLGDNIKGKIALVFNKLGGLCPPFVSHKVQSAIASIFDEEEIEPLRLEEIKSMFDAYTIEDSVVNRPSAEYLPLEAQRLYTLGMVEIEQIRKEYDQQKYLEGVAYLLNAYAILMELNSKDEHLINQIENSYKELLTLNYTNSRFSEEQIAAILENLNIEEIAKRNQLEQWTKALLKIITEQKLTSKEDCEDDFSTTLARVIPRFVPSASNIQLLKSNELPNWNLKANEEFSVIQEGTVEIDGNKTYVTKLSLNTHDEFNDDDHSIVIESAHELTQYTKGSLMMIAAALEKALKIHSLYKNSKDGQIEDRQRLYELSAPLIDTMLDDATIEHKKRIQEFLRTFCEEWNREHKGMLNMNFDIDLLLNAAKHHDTGKAGSPLIVLLKPGALNNDEFENIKQHPMRGAEYLYGLLGFDPVVMLELVHHTQEGSRRGYPFDLKGNRYQQEINTYIAENFGALTDEERARLEDTIETLQGKRNKDMIMSFDIIEALNAKSRSYRDQLSLQQLVGFAVSNIGINFPHYVVHAFVKYVNKGIFNELISHGKIPNGVKNEFELPVSYKLDDVIEYLGGVNDQEFLDRFKIDQESSVKGLSAGAGCGVAISKQAIRAEMFGMYMRTFKLNAKETHEQYGEYCDDFAKEFEKWALANGKHSVDEHYGSSGYSDKPIQDALDGFQSSALESLESSK